MGSNDAVTGAVAFSCGWSPIRGEVDRPGLSVGVDAHAGRHGVTPVRHDLEVEVVERDRLARIDLHPLSGGRGERRSPRGRRIAVDGRRRPGLEVAREAGGRPGRDPAGVGAGDADELVDELVGRGGRDPRRSREAEFAPGGHVECPRQAPLVLGIARRHEDRARAIHREHEPVRERVGSDVVRQVDRHTRDLLDVHVLRAGGVVANADLGESDAAHAAVARPLPEVRVVDGYVERLHGAARERDGLTGVRA